MEFARGHDPDGQPWPELKIFLNVIECRERAVAARQEFSEDNGDLPDPPPTAAPGPAHRSEGFQRKGFGADLALELCFNSLKHLSGMMEYPQMIEQVDDLSRTSQREPILLVVDYARTGGLIPPA